MWFLSFRRNHSATLWSGTPFLAACRVCLFNRRRSAHMRCVLRHPSVFRRTFFKAIVVARGHLVVCLLDLGPAGLVDEVTDGKRKGRGKGKGKGKGIDRRQHGLTVRLCRRGRHQRNQRREAISDEKVVFFFSFFAFLFTFSFYLFFYGRIYERTFEGSINFYVLCNRRTHKRETRNEEQGTRNKEQGTRDKGQWTRDEPEERPHHITDGSRYNHPSRGVKTSKRNQYARM